MKEFTLEELESISLGSSITKHLHKEICYACGEKKKLFLFYLEDKKGSKQIIRRCEGCAESYYNDYNTIQKLNSKEEFIIKLRVSAL